MKKLLHLFLKYKIWLLGILKPLGFWGLAGIGLVDAAAIPVPMDLITPMLEAMKKRGA